MKCRGDSQNRSFEGLQICFVHVCSVRDHPSRFGGVVAIWDTVQQNGAWVNFSLVIKQLAILDVSELGALLRKLSLNAR